MSKSQMEGSSELNNPAEDTFMSPKRKRIMSPNNCAKVNKEHASTHIPKHRGVREYEIDYNDEVRHPDNVTEGVSDKIHPAVGLSQSPDTATFLRRVTEPTARNEPAKFGNLKTGNIFSTEGNCSSEDEKEMKRGNAAMNGRTDGNRYKFEETKQSGVRHITTDVDGEPDTGAESDFSGVAKRMLSLSVGKHPSSFRNFARRTSPGTSPSSSQNSSLDSSLVLSPARLAVQPLGLGILQDDSPLRRSTRRPSGSAAPLSEQVAAMQGGIAQPGRRGKVSKLVASAILNHSAALGDRAVRSPGSGSTHLEHADRSANDTHLTHLAAFHAGASMVNHSNTELLYHSDSHSDGANHSGFHGSLMNDSRGSSLAGHSWLSGGGGGVHAPRTPYTPLISSASSDSRYDSYQGIGTEERHDAARMEAAANHAPTPRVQSSSGAGATQTASSVVAAHIVPAQGSGKYGEHASRDEWDVGLPFDAGSSPVLTPNRPRRVRSVHSNNHSQNLSLSLSQQSYHEAAMGDLGTPVTEVGSPAMLDGIDDLEEEDESADEEDADISGLRAERIRGRALFNSSRGGSLFQDDDEEDQQEVKSSGEFSHRDLELEQDDAEMVQITSAALGHGRLGVSPGRPLPLAASGRKHALEQRDTGSSVASSAGSSTHRRTGPSHAHQRIRTHSPFVTDSTAVAADLGTDSRDASFAYDDHEYHLFAQRFLDSPTHAAGNDDALHQRKDENHRYDRKRSEMYRGQQRSGLDYSADTTAPFSDTRSHSGTFSLSKSSADAGFPTHQDSSGMDTSMGSLSTGTTTTRPLPDQSAFDGPAHADLSRSSYANSSTSMMEAPCFGSPGSARKRRPCQFAQQYSPTSTECSLVASAPPTPLKGGLGLAWGTPNVATDSPGGPGVLPPNKAMRVGGEPSAQIHAHMHAPARTAHGAAADYTPSPAIRRVGHPLLSGIAVPNSTDSAGSTSSDGSDILVHNWRSTSDNLDDVAAPSSLLSGYAPDASHRRSSSEPFASISGMRALGLVRQSSLMDTKLLLSQDDGSDRPISFRSDFEELGHLGSGTFADVYKVRQRRGAPANVFYAVKKSKVQFRSKRERDMLLVEVRAMKLLGQQRECAYVVPFIRAWQEDSFLYVQMGFAERGTLRELMIHLATPGRRGSGGAALAGKDSGAGHAGGARSEGLVPNNTVWHVVHDVCAGLQHIHACGYVHLDIKPANLLITEGGTLQIGDFGMAAAIGRKGDDNEGDTRYLAEELLNDTERLPSADMFSLGLTLYELSCFFAEQDASSSSSSSSTSAGGEVAGGGEAGLRFTISRGLPSQGPLWHTLREDRAPPLPAGRPASLQHVVAACMSQLASARPAASQILALAEVQDTLDDVDAVLLCAPRHADVPPASRGMPYLARSASVQGMIEDGVTFGSARGGAGIVGASAVPGLGDGNGLRIAVGTDNQIDYAALGDGAFTPNFSHSGHNNYSPR